MPSHREVNWINVVFMTLLPVAAFIGVGLYLHDQGLHQEDLLSFWFMLSLTGLSITAGYHRYYSHRSYECHPVLQAFYLLLPSNAANRRLSWPMNASVRPA